LHFFHLDNECRVQADKTKLTLFWDKVTTVARATREQAEQAMYGKPLSAGDVINLGAIPPGSIVYPAQVPMSLDGLGQLAEINPYLAEPKEPFMPQQRGAGRIRSPRTLMSQQLVPPQEEFFESWKGWKDKIWREIYDTAVTQRTAKLVEPPKPETLSPIPNRNKIRKITLKDD